MIPTGATHTNPTTRWYHKVVNDKVYYWENPRSCWYPSRVHSNSLIPITDKLPKQQADVSRGAYVESPKHYTNHPSGIECTQITTHMGFNLGNVVKYVWRCDLKESAIEDLKKAQVYLGFEIAKREKENQVPARTQGVAE